MMRPIVLSLPLLLLSLITLVALTLFHPTDIEADGHCEYGEIAPENPINDDCWATPKDLGPISVRFNVVPVIDHDGNPVCRQDNRLEFLGGWADGDFEREINVSRPDVSRPFEPRTRPWADRHELVGIGAHRKDTILEEWGYLEAARIAPTMVGGKRARIPLRFYIEDGVDTASLVANRTAYGEVSHGHSDFNFDWTAALYACAETHKTAESNTAMERILSHVNHINGIHSKLWITMDAHDRLSEIQGRAEQIIYNHHADGEQAYLAFGQWMEYRIFTYDMEIRRLNRSVANANGAIMEIRAKLIAAGVRVN